MNDVEQFNDAQFGVVSLQTLDQLIRFIEAGRLRHGTSATAGVSQIEIDGKWYEIQMRLEGNPKSFIGEVGVVQTAQMGESVTLS